MIQSIEIDRVIGIEAYLYNTYSCSNILDYKPPQITSFIVIEHLSNTGLRHALKKHPGTYTLAILEKEGYDTYNALRILSSKLRLNISAFRYFGLKDANAHTYQYLVIPGILSNIVHVRSERGFIKLYPVGFLNKVPSQKLHDANIFRIRLERLVDEHVRLINNRLKLIARYSLIPSYYGYQRFGTIRPISHIVGKYVIEEDYCKALEVLVAGVYPDENPLAILSRRRRENLPYPENIITYKLKQGQSCHEIVKWLENNFRGLFRAAYASYVFNRIVSKTLLSSTLDDLLKDQIGYTKSRVYELLGCRARAIYLDENYMRRLLVDICGREEFVDTQKCVALMEKTRMFKRPLLFPLRIFEVREGKTSIIIGVVLPRGAYATVFLREVFCNIILS